MITGYIRQFKGGLQAAIHEVAQIDLEKAFTKTPGLIISWGVDPCPAPLAVRLVKLVRVVRVYASDRAPIWWVEDGLCRPVEDQLRKEELAITRPVAEPAVRRWWMRPGSYYPAAIIARALCTREQYEEKVGEWEDRRGPDHERPVGYLTDEVALDLIHDCLADHGRLPSELEEEAGRAARSPHADWD